MYDYNNFSTNHTKNKRTLLAATLWDGLLGRNRSTPLAFLGNQPPLNHKVKHQYLIVCRSGVCLV